MPPRSWASQGWASEHNKPAQLGQVTAYLPATSSPGFHPKVNACKTCYELALLCLLELNCVHKKTYMHPSNHQQQF